jgi:hypothetical protein
MDTLLWIAIGLIVLWIIAAVTEFVAGLLLNLLLILGIILLAAWVIRKVF